MPDTVCGQHNTETPLQSDTADNIIWARFATPPSASSTRQQIEFKSLSNTYTFTRRDPRSRPRHIPHFDSDFDDAEADGCYSPI